MKVVLFVLLMLASQSSFAAGFHYCSGKITNLVTRATPEDSWVMIEDMKGWAKLGYGGPEQTEMQKRQFSMLLSAYMAGKSVTLEFEDNALSCLDSHNSLLIRFVQLTN